MVPEFGQFALILAFCLSVILAILPIAGAARGNELWMSFARPLSAGIFVFLSLCMVILGYAFVTDDFSVQFVASHSNTLLPLQYKITAIWGGHEGSFLFWTFMLSFWMLMVSIFSKSLPIDFVARVLGVLGILAAGYILFMVATSNPFDRVVPLAPQDGADLNSALQDIAFILHPPTLYMGYVGFSVVFAFAIAALLSGRLDAAWARWSRPWANIAWVWLTGGLALGSWWAYYELGWGGWWAWDPVENPPLITWLLGTALMHSLAVTEKRGVFKSWTVLLAILAFAGSLLGTFITRSGLLTSVHAFASDPTRGVFILAFFAVTVGGSLILYALRAPLIKNDSTFSAVSREVMLLINNIFLVVASASVLLGTLFPMVYQALTDELISIGPPYFNAVFVPLAAALAVALGIGPISRWKSTSVSYLQQQLTLVAVASVALGVILPLVITLEFSLSVTIGISLALWLLFTIGKDIVNRVANKPDRWKALLRLPAGYLGMQLAHSGVAIMIVGVCLTANYSVEKSVLLASGQSIDLGDYDFQFQGTRPITGPNYIGDEATVVVNHNGEFLRELHPEKRIYVASNSPSTEMAIDAGLFRDLFVTLGEGRNGGATWSMTLYIKPFVRWIWMGAILMAIGGFTAALDKRYRKLRARDQLSLGADGSVTAQPQTV